MEKIYEQTLTLLEQIVNALAEKVPKPKLVNFRNFHAFRYDEKTIHQAIIQKLARIVSTLDAARLLLNNGFIQEQASLQRILDELREDVEFLVTGVLQGDDKKNIHRDYLDAFFQEEFDSETAIESTQKRPMIPRQKIRAYLARTKFAPIDPSSGIELSRTISKTYSGFVHAASPQIMEMYGGDPGCFHMRGLKDTPVYKVYEKDLWNYFYRSICACAMAASAFNDTGLLNQQCIVLMKQYEKNIPD